MSSPAGISSFKRMVVEAAVIVASILLAFGIDAGWDRMQARAEERQLLGRVHAELNESRLVLLESLAVHRAYRDSARVVADYGAGDPVPPPPSRTAVEWTFLGGTSTHFQTGVLDGALASGQLGLVTNQDLRGRLAGWPATVREFQEEEVWVLEFLQSIRSVAVRHLDLRHRTSADPSEPVSGTVSSFLRTAEGRNLAELRATDEGLAIRDGEILLEALDELLDLLRDEVALDQ